MADRFVTLGLARVRSPWFSDVARWATSGSLAMDFLKTVSVDEVKARLDSGRPFSALLLEGGLPGIDRDLLELASERGCAVVVVADNGGRDWRAIGAAATLPTDFGLHELEAVLAEHALPIGRADDIPGQVEVPVPATGLRARTIAVTGPGGTGRSTLAIAVAQGLASDAARTDAVVLADLALHAEQSMLHDARDVIPGILELVDAHRSGVPSPDEIRSLTFDIVDRRYRLLLGLRRHNDWTALRPRALRAALDGLRQTYTTLVADIDDDLEGESLTGSADVEDRNLLARTVISLADVVVVVGQPGMKGVHSMLRVVRDVLAAGVEAERIVPVVNRAPNRSGPRSELARTVTELLVASSPDAHVLSPVFVPDRPRLDQILRDGIALPDAVIAPVADAVLRRLAEVDQRAPGHPLAEEPVAVVPGSLGSWDEEVAG